MFEFLNPFRYFRAKKRARLEAEKQIALRKERLEEALTEAKRRQEYADHLDELRRVVKQPRAQSILKPVQQGYQPTYSDADSVNNLLHTISEQSRVTAFEMGSVDIPSSDNSSCSSSSDSGSSSDSSSCGSTD